MWRKIRGPLILLLFAVVLLANLTRMAALQYYHAAGPLAAARNVVIPEGGTAAAANALKADGAIVHPLAFRAAARLSRDKNPVRAGEFRIPAHASLWQILWILRFGNVVEHQVTIPEGLTGVQIARLLNAAPAASGIILPPEDGSILPQTYDYTLNTPRARILARAAAALQKSLLPAWNQRDPGLPLATPRQAIILASIVQAETPIAAELPKIAAVYENRLRQAMWLQADPTVIYAASNGATAGGQLITRTDLANPSPYNSYAHPGLPPGPICAPGLAAIKAVLHPAQTKDLYFVATGTGGHVFAQTYSQQLANIASFRRQAAN